MNQGSISGFLTKPWDGDELRSAVLQFTGDSILSHAGRRFPSYLGSLFCAKSTDEAQGLARSFLADPQLMGCRNIVFAKKPGAEDKGPQILAMDRLSGEQVGSVGLDPDHRELFGDARIHANFQALVRSIFEPCRLACAAAEAWDEMRLLSERDALSGIFNRRAIEKALSVEWARSRRNGRVFSVLLMDVDSFKTINDLMGHETGDRGIQAVASILEQSCRAMDSAGRYGGDEFFLLFPETSKIDAAAAARRIQEKIAAAGILLGLPDGLSLSIGIADTQANPADAAQLLAFADQAMYRVKRAGRKGIGF